MPIRLPTCLVPAMVLVVTLGAATSALAQTTSDVVDSVSVAIDIQTANADVSAHRYVINLVDCRALARADEEITIAWTLERNAPEGALYTIKIREKGQECATSSLSEEGSDECDTWVQQRPFAGRDTITVQIPWSDITHIDEAASCDDVTNDWDDVILIFTSLSTTTEDDDTDYDETRFEYTTDRPTAPTDVEVSAGESTLAVSWSEVDDAESYDVFYSTTRFQQGDEPENIVSQMADTDGTSLEITSGIQTGVTYYIAVSSVDTYFNASLLSEVVQAETRPTQDFYELYRGMGGSDQGCAVAGVRYRGWAAFGLAALTVGVLLLGRRRARRRDAR